MTSTTPEDSPQRDALHCLRLKVSSSPGAGRMRAVNQKNATWLQGDLEKKLGIAAEQEILKAAGTSYRITFQEEEV